jgi:ArsR family transcriptional regulator, arsenate/arsenite/antimonite-responsive transcriptional repressor
MVLEQDDVMHMSAAETRLVGMFKALGNPIRFQIIKTLAERQVCITQEIVDSTPLAQSTVSQHLKVLREAGLIQGEIEGPATCYCVNPASLRWLKTQLNDWLPGCCGPESRPASKSGPPPCGDCS